MLKYSRSNFLFWINCLSFFCLFNISAKEAKKNFPLDEKPLVVVVPSYNNIQWYKNNLDSIFMQKYKNYRVIYIDDCSNDGMGEAVEKYLDEMRIDFRIVYFDDKLTGNIINTASKFKELINEKNHYFTMIRNKNRAGALANFYRSILSCKDKEIIAVLDGDDWFYYDEVLMDLNEVYSSNNVWLTHGNLIHYPGYYAGWCEPIPPEIIEKNAFREFKCPSHLRTFYVWLFKKIKLEDLLWNGNFFPMTCDMATMYPMIEMAGERHAFIEKPNYVYNTSNQINDNKVDPKLQRDLDEYIRKMPRYKRLKDRP